jgi:peptide/nickel transport system substrate-binding protein
MTGRRLRSARSSLSTLLAASALVVLVSACSGAAATPTAAPATVGPSAAATVADTTPRGGTMTIINGSDLSSWDPCITLGTYPGGPMDALDSVYGYIWYADLNGKIVPNMAKSIDTADAITWTIKIREGLKFTDGTAYDADAVKYNWDRAADPANTCTNQKWIATWNTGITKVDSLTLQVKLTAADSAWAAKVAELFPFVASPTALKAAAKKTDIKPTGAGAFILDKWNQGVSSQLRRNPDYWDQPRPYLDTLKYTVIQDSQARIATVVQGGATMMAGYLFQFGPNATAAGVVTHLIPMRGIYYGRFNFNAAASTSDLRVRQFIYYAMDRQKFMTAWTQDPSYKSPTTFYGETSPYYDASLALPAADSAKAQAALDSYVKEKGTLNFQIMSYNNPEIVRGMTYMMQVLNTYKGVNATMASMAQSDAVAKAQSGAGWDIYFTGGALVFNGTEPNTFNLFSSTGSLNYGKYNSTAMNADLAEAAAAATDAGKKAAYIKVQQQILSDLPDLYYGIAYRNLLMRDNTCGLVHSQTGILQKQFLYLCAAGEKAQ